MDGPRVVCGKVNKTINEEEEGESRDCQSSRWKRWKGTRQMFDGTQKEV